MGSNLVELAPEDLPPGLERVHPHLGHTASGQEVQRLVEEGPIALGDGQLENAGEGALVPDVSFQLSAGLHARSNCSAGHMHVCFWGQIIDWNQRMPPRLLLLPMYADAACCVGRAVQDKQYLRQSSPLVEKLVLQVVIRGHAALPESARLVPGSGQGTSAKMGLIRGLAGTVLRQPHKYSKRQTTVRILPTPMVIRSLVTRTLSKPSALLVTKMKRMQEEESMKLREPRAITDQAISLSSQGHQAMFHALAVAVLIPSSATITTTT